jgi:hypothetical protein
MVKFSLRLLALACCFYSITSLAAELRGSLALEHRSFLASSLTPAQHNSYSSFTLEPEFYFQSDNSRHSLTFSPFYRQDSHDDERTHGDVRELYWLLLGDWYEISAGARKIFWGTTESQHLVDVINQTDLVENLDGEDKLGQPMLSTKLITDFGVFDYYVLPGFRERTFPSNDGRLHPFPVTGISTKALYEDDKKDKHTDWAVRWSGTFSSWDIGLSHFQGTSREPLFVSSLDSIGESVISPYYELMRQTAIDIQGAVGSWLWKAEAIHRDTKLTNFSALTAGLEYTFYQVTQTSLDVGIVAEYLYDNRSGLNAPPFEDDLMLGIRLNPNDIQGTEFLLGVIRDRSNQGSTYRLEAGRRLSDHWRLNLEATIFSGFQARSPLYNFRNDDFIQAEIRYYF